MEQQAKFEERLKKFKTERIADKQRIQQLEEQLAAAQRAQQQAETQLRHHSETSRSLSGTDIHRCL